MRVRLKGLNRVKVRLASGETVTYHYAWKGGPRLSGEPGTPEFVAAYNAAIASRKKASGATMHTLIGQYKAASEFTKKAEKTRRDYLRYIKLIEDEFGDMPIEALADPEVRGEFKDWRDKFVETPRKADMAWTVLARILSVAKDRGRIPVNPCEKGGRLYEADRAEIIWTADHIKAFNAVAWPELRFALLLALWTGQRQGDLLKLTWAAYDGTHIRLRQSKRKKRVLLPVGTPLKAALDRAHATFKVKVAADKTVPVQILLNSRGQPWTESGFRASWTKAFDRSGITDDLHFHDIRGTAVTRLALAGATVPQISAFTGLSLRDVEAILDAHYLGGAVELAEMAGAQLNAAFGVIAGGLDETDSERDRNENSQIPSKRSNRSADE